MDKYLGKILIIDDDEDVLLAAKLLLKKHAEQVIVEKNPKNIPFLLENTSYDVILLDMNFSKDTTSGKEGFFWLNEIKKREPKAVVVLITAFGDVEKAVKALKAGATDFVLKPWRNSKLLATLNTAVKLKRSYSDVDKLHKARKQLEKDISQPFRNTVAESQSMQNIDGLINKIAGTDTNVLIVGEKGTGKALTARAIHQKSLRSESIFLGISSSTFNKDLIESEFFGHKKGAFLGADSDKKGHFELANGGTLFLHEIENLSITFQSKLLETLANKEITRLGDTNKIPIDIRFICSSKSINLLKENTFNQELFHKINTEELYLPPLRERVKDIAQLVSKLIEKSAKKSIKVEERAIEKLQKYSWPGNTRELENVIERAILISEKKELTIKDFPFLNESL